MAFSWTLYIYVGWQIIDGGPTERHNARIKSCHYYYHHLNTHWYTGKVPDCITRKPQPKILLDSESEMGWSLDTPTSTAGPETLGQFEDKEGSLVNVDDVEMAVPQETPIDGPKGQNTTRSRDRNYGSPTGAHPGPPRKGYLAS